MEQSGNEDNLIEFIHNIETPLNLHNYQKIAQLFQVLVENEIWKILSIYNNSINMILDDIEICYPGSALNTSPAIGYIVEAYLTNLLPESIFSSPDLSTIKSAYDFKYIDDEIIELVVNLKVEKNTGSKNDGIVAGKLLRTFYTSNNKPKLYLILKLSYRIDEEKSILYIENVDSLYLESFLSHDRCLKADHRNWSEEFEILSGRLQIPSHTILDSLECGITTIPTPEITYHFIEDLNNNLKKVYGE